MSAVHTLKGRSTIGAARDRQGCELPQILSAHPPCSCGQWPPLRDGDEPDNDLNVGKRRRKEGDQRMLFRDAHERIAGFDFKCTPNELGFSCKYPLDHI